MTLSYATMRAKDRVIGGSQARGVTRHAVDDNSYACGALDTFCGQAAYVKIGDWEPDHPDACTKCLRALAIQEKLAS